MVAVQETTSNGAAAPAGSRSVKRSARRKERGVTPVATTATQATEAAVATAPAPRPTNDVLAGGLARSAAQATIHPIDTIKVRMQMMLSGRKGGLTKYGYEGKDPAGKAPAPKARATNLGKAVSTTAVNMARGVTSLYQGVGSAAFGAGIALGTYFWFYNGAKRAMEVHVPEAPSSMAAFVAGAVGALGSSFVKVPAAVCIRSVQAGVYPNGIAAFTRILKVTGPRGLYTGYLPTVIEDVPDMVFKFAAYEALGSVYWRVVNKPREEGNRIDDLIVGGIAGSIAAAATTPVDVIKTRMMCDAASRPTVLSAARAVAAEGKMSAWFAGVGPRSISSGINSAVFFCFLETLRNWQARREEARIRATSASGGVDTHVATA